ncbi:MAG: glycoside hydrolase family 127 protein [Planctomycetes bacterium]|nr:glycoside hydrolase family 127 protein [Planctomycetota bacterium]
MNAARLLAVGLVVASAGAACAAEPALKRLSAVPFTDVRFADAFWTPRLETNRTASIPHNFKMCEDTGRLTNFDKAAGRMEGKFEGIFFNDSDVYKVVEGAAYALAAHPDAEQEKYLDAVIARIAAAQQPDGYLYTFYTVNKTLDKRFTDCRSKHEMYCAGHLIEAAVAHYRATGRRTLLDVAVRLADHIDSIFGPDKRHDIEGHPEPELALVKLAEAAGERRYLDLAAFFIGEHGHNACGRTLYGDYAQDHKPLVEQTEPAGHAVRAMYFYSGAADVAARTGNAAYLTALRTIWENLATKKMHLTGGVGARHSGEAFGDAYELPNLSAYCETCAGIGLALFSHRMNLLTADARYADVVERVAYNGFLSGVSLDGRRFFYVNPLASRGNHHRQAWFGCACCPPNVVRFMASLPGLAYAHDDESVYVNLYAGGKARVAHKAGPVALAQETRYPWDGKVAITVEGAPAGALTLALRVPAWARSEPSADDLYRYDPPPQESLVVKLNGDSVRTLDVRKGYLFLSRRWRKGDRVDLDLPMPVRRVYAHPKVQADAGRVAVQRGPVVYCAEAADNGKDLRFAFMPPDAALAAEHRADLLGGLTVIRAKAKVRQPDGTEPKTANLVLIPYYAWDHREAGEMMVWLPEKADLAAPTLKPTIAAASRASASHCWHADTVQALNDQIEPANSGDHEVPRLTWWDRRGKTEWVQYDFARPAKVSATEVYWFDDTGRGGCRAPRAWRILARVGGEWKPVEGASECGAARDKYNRVTFTPVEADGLRLEVDLQAGFSGGILEWKVGGESKP